MSTVEQRLGTAEGQEKLTVRYTPYRLPYRTRIILYYYYRNYRNDYYYPGSYKYNNMPDNMLHAIM